MRCVSPTLSLEFFPPKTAETEARFWDAIKQFSKYKCDFISITYGAGGGDRERTVEFICRVKRETELDTVAHLTCIGDSEAELSIILDRYQSQGITRILALRGDEPKDNALKRQGVFSSADQFVSFIRDRYPNFKIAVAAYPEGHPEAVDQTAELQYFKKKVDAGADFAITQFFFENSDYYKFIANCQRQGIKIPIIPGIMPVTEFKQIQKLSHLCGSRLPKWLCKKLEKMKDDPQAMEDFGVEVAIKQCRDLLDNGAPGLHFFTMNQAATVTRILDDI